MFTKSICFHKVLKKKKCFVDFEYKSLIVDSLKVMSKTKRRVSLLEFVKCLNGCCGFLYFFFNFRLASLVELRLAVCFIISILVLPWWRFYGHYTLKHLHISLQGLTGVNIVLKITLLFLSAVTSSVKSAMTSFLWQPYLCYHNTAHKHFVSFSELLK